jgi:hypothetical protein
VDAISRVLSSQVIVAPCLLRLTEPFPPPGGDPGGGPQRGGQDEHRHGHPVGLLGWNKAVLQEERRLPTGPGI